MNKIDLSKEFNSVNSDINIKCAGNGWVLDVSGRSSEDEWKSTTILCDSLDVVMSYLTEHSQMKMD